MTTPEPTSFGIEGNDMTVGLAGERDKVDFVDEQGKVQMSCVAGAST